MKLLLAIVAAAAALALAVPAQATVTYTVTDNGDGSNTCSGPASTTCTLRSALAGAMENTDKTAVINLADKTFTLTQGELDVDAAGHSVVINGATGGATKIDGGGQTYLFYLDDTTTTKLNGLTLQNARNTLGSGGAIYSFGGNLELAGSTVRNATEAITGEMADDGPYAGGAIAIDAGDVNTNPKLKVTNSTISGNALSTSIAAAVGGGIAAGPGKVSVTISQSLISGNTVTSGTPNAAGGGGVYVYGLSTLAMDNSTVFDNTAGLGAGIAFDGTASSTVSQSTIAGNHGAGLGFRGDDDPATTTDRVTVDRSIVSGGASGCATERGGVIVDGGSNLDAGSSCGFSGKDADAQLSGLRSTFFGGQQVLVPAPGSPAIDAAGATCPTFVDARPFGDNRPVDGNLDGTKACDIGAVEFIPASRKVTEGAPRQTTETLKVEVTNGDAPVKVRVVYGPGTGNYPNSLEVDVPYDTATATVTPTLTGLTPGSIYHYRVQLLDGKTTLAGPDGAFTTRRFPGVAIAGATAITETGATLNGRLDGNNNAGVSYHFEYGPTDAYGTSTPDQAAAVNANPVDVSAPVTGLTGATTYHYRLVASFGGQTFATADRTVTTAPPPALVASAGKLGKLKLAKAKRYRVSITCSRACTLAGRLTTTKKLARKLKRKPTLVKASGEGAAGTATTLSFKLSKKLRKRLRAKKVRSLKLVVVATPESGLPVTVTGTVRIG